MIKRFDEEIKEAISKGEDEFWLMINENSDVTINLTKYFVSKYKLVEYYDFMTKSRVKITDKGCSSVNSIYIKL